MSIGGIYAYYCPGFASLFQDDPPSDILVFSNPYQRVYLFPMVMSIACLASLVSASPLNQKAIAVLDGVSGFGNLLLETREKLMNSTRHDTVVADHSILNCTFSSPVGVVTTHVLTRLYWLRRVLVCVHYRLVLEIRQVPTHPAE